MDAPNTAPVNSSLGGAFGSPNRLKCERYAGFMSHLDRTHFDQLYWFMFVGVIAILFLSSYIYQWAIRYKEEFERKPEFDQEKYKRRLKVAISADTPLALVSVTMCVLEVYTLLALQFCDGEDLMPLFWATWTTLQMGATIANLGIVLALLHILCNFRQPLWALALGTPVLVVAGVGHLITWTLELCFKKVKKEKPLRRLSRSFSRSMDKGFASPSAMSSGQK